MEMIVLLVLSQTNYLISRSAVSILDMSPTVLARIAKDEIKISGLRDGGIKSASYLRGSYKL